MQRKAKLPAPDWTQGGEAREGGGVKRVGWKALQALKPGATLKDHHVVGLRWKRDPKPTREGLHPIRAEWRYNIRSLVRSPAGAIGCARG